MRKPFWKKSHKCWYVRSSSGEDVRLDPNEDEAHKLWRMMVDAACPHDGASVASLIDAWLQEHDKLLPPLKYSQAEGYLLGFAVTHGETRCIEVTRGMLHSWLSAPKPGKLRKDGSRGPDRYWAVSTQKDAAACVRRVYRWAHAEGKISRNPLALVKIADPEPRLVLVDPSTHERVVASLRQCIDDRPFALYLIASKCGCRPKHIRDVTAAHVSQDGGAWIFAKHKTRKKTGRALVIHLHPCVATLTRILLWRPQGTQGNLFGNEIGDPWKKDTVCRRMARLRKRLNLPPSYIAYAYRHTFATDTLLAGVSIPTAAVLMGHSDTRTVTRVYGHLDQHIQHLREAAALSAAQTIKNRTRA